MVDMLQQDALRVRANVFRLLGGVFLAELSTEIITVLRYEETWEIFATLAPLYNLRPLRELVDSEEFSLDAVRLEFHRLFSVPTGPYVFPYESCYSVAEPPGPLMGPTTVAVVNAYAESGFSVDPAFMDAPDHFGVELRFVAELIDREAQSLDDGDPIAAESYASLRIRFCREHLSRWAGKLATRISSREVSEFYSEFSALVRAVVAEET